MERTFQNNVNSHSNSAFSRRRAVVDGNYFISTEGTKLVLFQYTRKLRARKRVPRKKYRHVGKSREALQAFVDRLNHGVDLKRQREREVKSAFIPEQVFAAFRDTLQSEIPNQKDFRYLHNTCFTTYFFNYFIQISVNPNEWSKHQVAWGNALMGRNKALFEKKPSAKTIKTVVQVANRFMRLLHTQIPHEYPLIKLSPISKGALKTYEAERKREKGDEPVGKFIPDSDWEINQPEVRPRISPALSG